MKQEIISFGISIALFVIIITISYFLPDPYKPIIFYSHFLGYILLNNSIVANLQERIEDLEKGEFDPHKYKK